MNKPASLEINQELASRHLPRVASLRQLHLLSNRLVCKYLTLKYKYSGLKYKYSGLKYKYSGLKYKYR